MRLRNIPSLVWPAAGSFPLMLALCAFIVGGLAVQARCGEKPTAAAASPQHRPEISAHAAKKGKDSLSPPAKDSKGGKGNQNSPFGMLKFSADNGPIQIKANSLSLDYKDNSVMFSGAVHATQSGTTLTSNSLKVIYGKKFGDIKQVIAMGDVKMSQGGRWATGQRAVLDEVKHTVEMTGSPVIHDGPDQVAGRRIIIYLDSEKSFVEGANAVIFPRTNKGDQQAAGQ